MRLILGLKGNIYINNTCWFSKFDDNLSLAENKKIALKKEAQALEKYGFKQTIFNDSLCEYKGTIKDLYEFCKRDYFKEKADGELKVSSSIYELFYENIEEICSTVADDLKCWEKALICKKSGRLEEAEMWAKKQLDNYNKKQAEEEKRKREEYLNTLYAKRIKGKDKRDIVDEMINVSINTHMFIGSVKDDFLDACRLNNDTAMEEYIESRNITNNHVEKLLEFWKLH